MSQARYYSPKIRRDLVSKLYREADSKKIPMTKLIDQIVAGSLGRYRIERSRRDRRSVREEQLMLDLGG
jgi:hypothetical protein